MSIYSMSEKLIIEETVKRKFLYNLYVLVDACYSYHKQAYLVTVCL